MEKIIGGKRYDTTTADLIATSYRGDDGGEWRRGRKSELYKTKRGAYFLASYTRWQGERNHVTVLGQAEAERNFENMDEKDLDYEEIFGTAVEA